MIIKEDRYRSSFVPLVKYDTNPPNALFPGKMMIQSVPNALQLENTVTEGTRGGEGDSPRPCTRSTASTANFDACRDDLLHSHSFTGPYDGG